MAVIDARPAASRTATRRIVPRAILVVAIALAGVLVAPGAAVGASSVSLTFGKIPSATIGSQVNVAATIKPSGGVPAAGLRVEFYVNGTLINAFHADVNGKLALKIPSNLMSKAGIYALRADFLGTHLLSPTRASASLKVNPAQISITTVPAIEGIPVSLGKASAKTGP